MSVILIKSRYNILLLFDTDITAWLSLGALFRSNNSDVIFRTYMALFTYLINHVFPIVES